ncbi:uncharacterized protein [Littorina saxatilis]|uniref:Uncharacterized protein n=1 Tax=Littorina saxatilis TaxID=31220 RepID=A0AAN9AKG3_9CAEN
MEESQAFLKKISKNIAKDEPSISRKEIIGYYHHFIQDLPDTDLRATLVGNKKECCAFFIRCVKTAARKLLAKTAQQNEKSPSKGRTKAVKKKTAPAPQSDDDDDEEPSAEPVQSADAVRQQIIELLRCGKGADEVEQLIQDLWVQEVKLRLTENGADLDRYCQMLMMTDGVADLRTLKNIMLLRFNTLRDDAEEIIARKMKKRAGKRLKAFNKFLKMCHIRKTSYQQESESFPTYADLVTGLLSIYLDLFITANRGEEVSRKVQRCTCSLVKQLTAGLGEKSLDTVLQMTAADSDTSTCLSSLMRYLLREKPTKESHTHYLRYVLTVCKWRNVLSDLDDLVLETRLVRAPKGFLGWAVEWQPQLEGEFPDDRKFKGRTITTFLLDDADEDMQTLLSDAIASCERQTAADPDAEMEEEDQSEEEEAQPGKKKRKKKKKKIHGAAATTKEDDLEATEDTEDVLFAVDRGSGVEGRISKTAKKRKSGDTVEVFDLSTLGNAAESPEPQEDNSGSLFLIDRGTKKGASVGGSEGKGTTKRKKKKKTTGAGVTDDQDVSVSRENKDSADQNGFFVDRGNGTDVSMTVTGGEDEPKKKKKKKTADGSNTSKQDTTVSIDSNDSADEASFYIDRGEKAAIVSSSENAGGAKKKKRKRARKSNSSSELNKQDDQVASGADSTDGDGLSSKETKEDIYLTENDKSAENKTQNGNEVERQVSIISSNDIEIREVTTEKGTIRSEQTIEETEVILTSQSEGNDTPMQADLTVSFSASTESVHTEKAKSPTLTPNSSPLKSRRRTASEKLVLSDQDCSDQNTRGSRKNSESSPSSQNLSESRRRRTVSDSHSSKATAPDLNQRQAADETLTKADNLPSPTTKQKMSIEKSTPTALSIKTVKLVSETSQFGSPFLGKMATLNIHSPLNKSPLKSTDSVKTGLSPTKSPLKLSESEVAMVKPGLSPTKSPQKSNNADEAVSLKTLSSPRSPTKSRATASMFFTEEVVPGSDSDETDDRHLLSNESMVPNSVSEAESQSEIALVPDLHVHLKQDSSEGATKEKRTSNSGSDAPLSSPSARSGKKSRASLQSPQTVTDNKSPAGTPTADSPSVKKSPNQKRKWGSLSPASPAETEEDLVSSSGEVEQGKKKSAKKTGLASPLSQREEKRSEESPKSSMPQKTPETNNKPKKKSVKSTTPISRRTRRQRKSMAVGTPTSVKSPKATHSEEESKMERRKAKSASKKARKTQVESPEKHAAESGVSSGDQSSQSQQDYDVAAPKRSRKSQVIASSEDADSSGSRKSQVIASSEDADSSGSGSTTKATRRKSVSLLHDFQKKALKSMVLDPKAAESPKSRKKSSKEGPESPKSFTKLKELSESPLPSSPRAEPERARKTSGAEESEERREKKWESRSPGKKSPSSAQESEGHEIKTRSKKKGYYLRKSVKF